MSRFSVGQKVWVVGFILTDKQGKVQRPYMYLKPRPFEYNVEKIFFEQLTITEEHAVPGEWSDEKQYKGYIAVNDKGDVFHNQYPRASYGQLDDTCDSLFTPASIEQRFIELKDQKVGFDTIVDEFHSKGIVFGYQRLDTFFSDVNGSFLDEDGLTRNQRAPAWPDLKDLLSKVIDAFKEKTDLTIESYVTSFCKTDKTTNFVRWQTVAVDGTKTELNSRDLS